MRTTTSQKKEAGKNVVATDGKGTTNPLQKKQPANNPLQLQQGVAVNDDKGLEVEADVMGNRAVQRKAYTIPSSSIKLSPFNNKVVQKVSFYIRDGKGKSKECTIESFEELTKVASELIKNEDKSSIQNLCDALESEFEEKPNKRSAWFQKNEKAITDLLKLLDAKVKGKEVKKTKEVETKPRKLEINFSSLEEKPLFNKGMGLNNFEKSSQSGDQGSKHYDKHGQEFKAKDKQDYIRQAQNFGKENGEDCIEASIGNTTIRYQPSTKKVLVANGRIIRTFYKWDPKYSSNPVSFAIYYTITGTMKIPLKEFPQDEIKKLSTKGIYLEKMEKEIILNQVEEGKTDQEIQNSTLAPVEIIKHLRLLANNPFLDIMPALQ